eukprot:332125-Chlamydomonas_euryale.AAC.2
MLCCKDHCSKQRCVVDILVANNVVLWTPRTCVNLAPAACSCDSAKKSAWRAASPPLPSPPLLPPEGPGGCLATPAAA